MERITLHVPERMERYARNRDDSEELENDGRRGRTRIDEGA